MFHRGSLTGGKCPDTLGHPDLAEVERGCRAPVKRAARATEAIPISVGGRPKGSAMPDMCRLRRYRLGAATYSVGREQEEYRVHRQEQGLLSWPPLHACQVVGTTGKGVAGAAITGGLLTPPWAGQTRAAQEHR